MTKERRERITFKATKIISKPTKVSFYTKKGEEVIFKAEKFIPQKIKIDFLAKKKSK